VYDSTIVTAGSSTAHFIFIDFSLSFTHMRRTKRKYGRMASKKVERAMREFKHGTLKGGKGRHPMVKSRKQAIAIGLSEARKAGGKVPMRRRS
jgi:hypothetical protein